MKRLFDLIIAGAALAGVAACARCCRSYGLSITGQSRPECPNLEGNQPRRSLETARVHGEQSAQYNYLVTVFADQQQAG